VKRGLAIALCLAAGSVVAATPALSPAAAGATGGAATGLVQVTLSLLGVLAIIFALAWGFAKLRLTPRHGRGALAVLAEIPLGSKERAVLLKVGDRQALLGIGADGVRSLELLDAAIALPAEQPGSSFAKHLAQALRPGTP
jgi:flagellar protein FliO/FliZ